MVNRQFLRFVVVGCVNTAFSYSLYAVLLWLGMHFALANLCATAVGIVFSFWTQGAIVFKNHDWRLLRRFVMVWVLIYALNIGFIAAFVGLGLNSYAAGALALVPTVILSFVLQRMFVFAPKRPNGALPASGIPQ